LGGILDDSTTHSFGWRIFGKTVDVLLLLQPQTSVIYCTFTSRRIGNCI
jgi:hypothetical protein